MLDYFDAFKEALILQERLNQLYQTEEDKKTIAIEKSILEVAKKCVIFLKQNFEEVIQGLKYLNLSAAEKKLPGLKFFESAMFEMKCFHPTESAPQSKELAFLAYFARQTR